jgi:hypothetical protein
MKTPTLTPTLSRKRERENGNSPCGRESGKTPLSHLWERGRGEGIPLHGRGIKGREKTAKRAGN